MRILGLGYLGVGTTDVDSWQRYGTEVLGMAVFREGDSAYLRMDERAWRIAVHPSEADGGLYVGWETANREEWEQAVAELEAAGVAVKVGGDEEARARTVRGIATFQDPGGNTVEIFYGQGVGAPFLSPYGTRFMTDAVGMGHVVLIVPANTFDEAVDFYVKTMGFRITEYGENLGPVQACLLHCNPRHHSLAILGAGDMNGIQHFMVEADEMDAVGMCWDRCRRADVPISLTLGRHGDDLMFSFYMKSPSGFDVEFGWGGRLVDDSTYSVATLTEKSGELWGHWPPDPNWPRVAEGPKKFGDLDPSKIMENTGKE